MTRRRVLLIVRQYLQLPASRKVRRLFVLLSPHPSRAAQSVEVLKVVVDSKVGSRSASGMSNEASSVTQGSGPSPQYTLFDAHCGLVLERG